MNKSMIFLLIIVLCCSCVFASNHRNATLAQIASYREAYESEYREWVDITNFTDGLDELNGEDIAAYNDKPHQYLLDTSEVSKDFALHLFEFKGHRDKRAELQEYNSFDPVQIDANNTTKWISENWLYYFFINEISGDQNLAILDTITGGKLEYTLNDKSLQPGKFFKMKETKYYLQYSDKKIYELDIRDTRGEVNIDTNYELTPTPADNTTVAVIEDKLYYFAEDGLYVIEKIEDGSTTAEKVEAVEVTDPESVILHEGPHKMWIINSTDGVVEYDAKKPIAEKAKKIAVFPPSTTRGTDAFFTEAEFIYYLDGANKKVYALDTHKKHKKHKEPRIPWGAPRIPFIEGGFIFMGPAEFFAMLQQYYLSIMCGGIPMMFLFDPRMCAFHLAPKAPHFDPANFANAFMDDKFFYVYNPDRNTITCTDTATGMEREIGCYEDMPEDIIQIVFANHCFFILTKSGENHIARLAGHNLKYVTTWKLDDWTPRTGATVVALDYAIYVFGGKELTDSKEESAGTCYNDLYMYDFRTGSSEKLDVDEDVTPRYNAKMMISRHWKRIWILGGKDESDAPAADIWEFNTRKQEWNYINDLPTEEGNASACYDEENDTMSVLVTPEEETDECRLFSTRDIPRASSGVAVYEMSNLAGSGNGPDQSGKSCGCLGLEFLFAIAGLALLRLRRK